MNNLSQKLKTSVIPFIKEYKISSEEVWNLSIDSRILITETTESQENERLQEIIHLVKKDFNSNDLLKINTNNKNIFINKDEIKSSDILIKINDELELSESYQIDINNTCLKITASTVETVLQAFQTLKQLLLNNRELPFGRIFDYPDLNERRLHLDMARKFISKDWIIRHIHKLASLKMNTLQLHFSENKGFRIESEFDPKIVSQDGFLNKDEVRDIIQEAQLYGIEIIPSLDTPGHVEHILKTHPEFGQVDIHGKHSKIALDITNRKAIDYVKSLYSEYMELFSSSKQFHIGGDEYLEFNREPFDSQYQPVLDTYALDTLGSEYTWKDIVVDYINEIAMHVSKGGFKPRIWNDAIYFGEDDIPQKIEMNDNIAIDYWSHMPWLKKVSSLNTIMEKGHKEIYNVHSSFFYYVLRDDAPDDGRPLNSFDILDQDKNIYENWTPGIFTGETIDNDDPVIQGACIAVWNDNPNIVSEDVIEKDIHNELITFAAKTWDYKSDTFKQFKEFKELLNKF